MRLIYSLLLLLSFAAFVHAKPISFIFEGHVSGIMEYRPDSPNAPYSSVKITTSTDTDKLTEIGYVNTPIQIELGANGVFAIEPDSQSTLNWLSKMLDTFTLSLPGFALSVSEGNFSGWWLQSSTGPVICQATTSRHLLPLGNRSTMLSATQFPLTFTAIVTPEPSSLCLCVGSIVLLGIRRRG